MIKHFKSRTILVAITVVSLALPGCSKNDSNRESLKESPQQKVAEKENQNQKQPIDPKSKVSNFSFSKLNSYSNLTVGNLTVRVSLEKNYLTNVYNLPLKTKFDDGVDKYYNDNSDKKLILVKNKVPILLETIDKNKKYTAQEIYYYSRYDSRSVSPFDKSRIIPGTILADKIADSNLLGKFAKASTFEFVKTSTRKGATGKIAYEEKTNFNAIAYSSIKFFPFGLAAINPWIEGGSLGENMQLENSRLFFRTDSDELIITSDDQSSRISSDQNLRFQLSGNGSDGYPIGLDNSEIFHKATETELLPFLTGRKNYSIKDAIEYEKDLLYNEYFEEFVNSVVTKSLAYAKNHAGLNFSAIIDSDFRVNIRADADGKFNPKDGEFTVLSDPFELFSKGEKYILKGHIKGENVELDKTVKWVYGNNHSAEVELPDQWTLRQFSDQQKVKLSLTGSKGGKSYKLRFLEMREGFNSRLPIHKLRASEYTGVAIMVIEAYGYPFPFLTGINESTDGSIKVDGVNGIPTFTLKPKANGYVVEDEPDLTFSVQRF